MRADRKTKPKTKGTPPTPEELASRAKEREFQATWRREIVRGSATFPNNRGNVYDRRRPRRRE